MEGKPQRKENGCGDDKGGREAVRLGHLSQCDVGLGEVWQKTVLTRTTTRYWGGDIMAEERKEEEFCVICQKDRAFPAGGRFDKCFSCAGEYSDEMRKKFIAILSPEQLALFEEYEKASGDFTSMAILD